MRQKYRIYPCIMRTFFTTFEAEKLRCALYTEPFVSEALLICIKCGITNSLDSSEDDFIFDTSSDDESIVADDSLVSESDFEGF